MGVCHNPIVYDQMAYSRSEEGYERVTSERGLGSGGWRFGIGG